MKKILSMCLATSMILGIVAGCSNEVEITQSTENDEQRITIEYWDAFCDQMLPGSYTESLIEDEFFVDIVVNRANYMNPAHVIDLLTEDNVPDVFWYEASSEYVESLGITRTIPREMVEQYAPSFIDMYEEYPVIYTSIMDYDNTDEFVALNGATESRAAIAGSLYADFYRYDWIENLGIDLEINVTQISDNFYVADTGPTLEKFEEIMHAFTYLDPDGNGIDDTIGASFESMTRFDLLYSGFDMITGINEVNGEAEQFYATENYRDFCSWFADMFSKGYIDENFYYQTREARWEMVYNEQVGYFLESSIAINSWANDRPPLSLIEANPEATFLITPGLSNSEGEGTIIKNSMPTFGRLCYISKDVDDEKLALILQILEYINFGDDTISFWFGEENVDWKYDASGSVEIINSLAIAEDGARVFIQNVQTNKLFEAINVEEVFAAGGDFWLYDCIWRENDREQYEYKIDMFGETNYAEYALIYNEDCVSAYYEFFENCVYNGLDAEENWEDYLELLDEVGYNTMVDELDKVEILADMIDNFVKH